MCLHFKKNNETAAVPLLRTNSDWYCVIVLCRVYEETWSPQVLAVKEQLTSSVINHLEEEISFIEGDTTIFYSEALEKFSYLLAYFDDKGELYCKYCTNCTATF